MDILLIEPYFGGSHKAWAEAFAANSRYNVQLLTLPAEYWKWRMQGGAVTLAGLYDDLLEDPDVILASDMFDLALFRSLTRTRTHNIPIALYFHENQLTYPQNKRQKHGYRYGFINYASALSADWIFFNSAYHRNVFFEALPRMLNHFADFNELESIAILQDRSSVLEPGVSLNQFDIYSPETTIKNIAPIIVWNHRWDEDKNPAGFFNILVDLMDTGADFQVALVGEDVRHKKGKFAREIDKLGQRIVAHGYIENFSDYARLLWHADYVVSTAWQEFFGISVVEAMYCGCIPLLPNRLNYPHLLPEAFHATCIYDEGELLDLMKNHLDGNLYVDVARLRKHVARYDWATMVSEYDNALENLQRS